MLTAEGHAALTSQYKSIEIDTWTDISVGNNDRIEALRHAEKAARVNQRGQWGKFRSEFAEHQMVNRWQGLKE